LPGSFFVFLLLTGCGSKEVVIEDIKLTNEIGSDGSFIALDEFMSDQPTIIVQGSVENVKEPFSLSVEWYYQDGDEFLLIHALEEVIEEKATDFTLDITSPYAGWPEGNYLVKIFKGEELIDEISYTVQSDRTNLHPSFLVGPYLFEKAEPEAPTNILEHYYEIHSDGTFSEIFSWSSKTMSSQTRGTLEGDWECVDGELVLYYGSYQYVYQIEGNRIVGEDIYWNDCTLYFIKPWMGSE
jgi:predicted transcriptional regulator with HTH domain